jgi:phosphatidylinositol kinase/protein kinase (PI-3  family)
VIHIVEGLVSLFDLFRKHHQPDDYYSKLQQRLQATKRHQKWLSEVKNSRDMEHHRAEWGVEKAVLLDIFRELSRANPSDLLQRELWLNALSAADWFKRVENFTTSTANVSMLGYVLGLGDRHLDNVLFDPRSGRLLHIDLNVCFESGAQLKVPETVPFRLTQNIRGGMRFGAVEGAFAEACTERLQALRSRAPLIVMLLEAFVLDEIRWDVRKRKHEPGAAIVRRVEQKLAGCDWGKTDMTAREQAEAAIAAAVDEENLAQMYAGWGAWW